MEDNSWISKQGQKAFIGLYSPEERKKIFLKYFEGVGDGDRDAVRLTTPPIQDPYNQSSWYSKEELGTLVNQPRNQLITQRFKERYKDVTSVKGDGDTGTNASLYTIKSMRDYFKHLLYERGDLFMKVVPLWEVGYQTGENQLLDDEDLSEIYNEVIVGYFLNELVYGYSGVLSIHFMKIVDWFIATKSVLGGKDTSLPYQMIITNKMDITVGAYLSKRASLDTIRGIVFQVFHALEIAWYTNIYVHNDLHLKNVMLGAIPEGSPLRDRHFLYRRLVDNRWYKVDRSVIGNMLLNIIDFGRNRMAVPTTKKHVDEDGEHIHHHEGLTYAKGMDEYGYPPDRANRHIDVKLFLLTLLVGLKGDEFTPFYDLCDRVIDFTKINHLVKNTYKGQFLGGSHINYDKLEHQWKQVGGKVTAKNYSQCDEVHRFLRVTGDYDKDGNLQKGVFIYRMDEEGVIAATPTDVLNDPFFDEYKLDILVPDHTIPPEEIYSIKSDHVVVSFITHPEEAVMLSSSGGVGSERCAVCNSPTPKHIAGDDLLCGGACYDFKYLFDCKTVYR
jgi:hypothetical protein